MSDEEPTPDEQELARQYFEIVVRAVMGELPQPPEDSQAVEGDGSEDTCDVWG